jgi:predicted alpha/beta hydrolase family esterase
VIHRQILFVQGGGQGAHDEWDNQLVESLRRELGSGYTIRYPRMPSEEAPKYASWKTALEREFKALPTGAILVAHSIGGAILLGMLAEHSRAAQLGAIFLIAAPFVGDGGWPSDELRIPSDFGARLPRDLPIYFYQGLGDEVVPPAHVGLYERAVPQARVHRLQGRDHQFNNDLKEVAHAIASLEASVKRGK